jgi:N-methylhydantoinase B
VTQASREVSQGVAARREVDDATLAGGPWDGRKYSYIPSAELGIPASVPLHNVYDTELDPVTYQVIRWKLWSMNLEHSDTIRKVSGSSIIVYMDDFNTSILTETGDTIVCGPSIQYFTGMSDLVVKWTLEHRSENPGIEPGDAFLQNDPFIGSPHQMDVALYAPVFHDGKLFCWLFSTAHHGDLGGIDPGSFCNTARDMFDEPTPVPPIKVRRHGVMQEDLVEMFTRHSRDPDNVALQIRSQLAGLHATSERMEELLDRYGPAVVKGVMRRMISDCSEAVSRRLQAIPDGEWLESEYVGGLSFEDRGVHRMTVGVRKQGDQMVITNRGSGEQFGSANCTYAGWRSAMLCCASTLLAYDQTYCPAGVLEHIRFDPVPETVTCAVYPAAVTTLTAIITSMNLGWQALGRMLLCGPPAIRSTANASGGQSMGTFWSIAGTNRNGKFVVDLTGDSLMGAIGAFPDQDGMDTGGSWWWPNSLAGDAEEWEQTLPMLYLYRAETTDSGAPGRWRGGNGCQIAFTAHKSDAHVQLTGGDPAINVSPGLVGGLPGHSGNDLYLPDSGLREGFKHSQMPTSEAEIAAALSPPQRVHPRSALRANPDDIIIFDYSTGAGVGDPLLRPAEDVARDVVGSAISLEHAARHYAVVFDADGNLDGEATENARAAARKERLAAASAPTAPVGGKLADASGIKPIGVGFGVAARDDSHVWACSECREILAPIDRNYKLGCCTRDMNPNELDPTLYPDPSDFCDEPIVMRLFFCPGCAQMVANETCRPGDEPLWDFKLDGERLGEHVRFEGSHGE